MALLPSDPTQQKAVIAVAVSVAAFYGYWSFVHGPRTEQMLELEERLEQLEQRNQTARVQNLRGGIQELEDRAIQYEMHVRRLEELIPASEEVAPLINTIQQEARALGITPLDLTPLPEEPGQHYTRFSYSLRLVGDYHQIGRFLTTIASGSRIITPVRMTVGLYEETQGRLGNYEAPIEVAFEVETYILPEPGSVPQATVGEGAEGG